LRSGSGIALIVIVALATVVLHERRTPVQYLGATTAVVGVVLVSAG
jgi:drug/metabolite transporter (DMT)-like permease